MSTSTDAILAFGFDIGEDAPWGWKDEEWDEYYVDKKGVFDPEPDSQEVTVKFREYCTRRGALLDACPVAIITHCSYECPQYIVSMKSTVIRASRGFPEEIEKLQKPEDWEAPMREFCSVMGITYEEPKWLLFSLWGV